MIVKGVAQPPLIVILQHIGEFDRDEGNMLSIEEGMKLNLSMVLCLLSATTIGASGQKLPPIFLNTPKAIVSAKSVAEFPANTFLENIAVDKKSNLFVTSLEDGKIYKITADGATNEFARIGGKIAGIVFDRKGDLLVTGWANGTTPSVFRVSAKGSVETLAAIDGAMFLNGITHLQGDTFLIADSYKGAIWEFNAKTKAYSIWLEDTTLARSNSTNPFPAVNGLKRFGNLLYATNTEQQKLLRIPILAQGKAGTPQIVIEKINGDDFALDASGNLYVTTHVYNNVVRITPDGKITVIAESGEGVTGSTALAFGRGKKDRQAVFVVTNGGMSLPPPNGVQPAKVVRLEVGANGAR